jgi:hypothetical protein
MFHVDKAGGWGADGAQAQARAEGRPVFAGMSLFMAWRRSGRRDFLIGEALVPRARSDF